MLKCSFAVTNHLFIVSVCPHSIMFLVGLTGGIATGKSTVADMFMQLDCPLVDADKIAKEGIYLFFHYINSNFWLVIFLPSD